MAFDYTEYCVVWTYHNANPSDYDPSASDLDDWDTQLVETYEAKLQVLMPEFDIPITTENKSRLVALAEISNGQSAGVKARNACRFFAAVAKLQLA
jgi:hypothetical protein